MVAVHAETLAGELLDRDDVPRRADLLSALEHHAIPIPTDVAFAAAPALVKLLSADASEVDRSTFDRAGLLLARLQLEALPDPLPLYGVAFRDHAFEKIWSADSVLNIVLRTKPASELTMADAISYSSMFGALLGEGIDRGMTAALHAAGYEDGYAREWYTLSATIEPLASQKPPSEVPHRMLMLGFELLQSSGRAELITGGWYTVNNALSANRALGIVALEYGMTELVVAQLNGIGTPADWIVSHA